MVRWSILRTLLYKEALRYRYNWGLLVMIAALLAMSALISISAISATSWRPRDFSGRSMPRVIRKAAFSVLGAAPTFASTSRS